MRYNVLLGSASGHEWWGALHQPAPFNIRRGAERPLAEGAGLYKTAAVSASVTAAKTALRFRDRVAEFFGDVRPDAVRAPDAALAHRTERVSERVAPGV